MTGTVAEIWRHPIKSHGREALAQVTLSEGHCIPWDRRWAVAHEISKFDAAAPGWTPCGQFMRGAKAPQLQAITACSDQASQTITLHHPELGELRINPDHPADNDAFIKWVAPICPSDRAGPARLVSAPQIGMTDTNYASISLISLASHADVGTQLGQDISPLRWRGNLLLDGLDAWAEMQWVGRHLRIGDAELEITEPITRCMATTANTRTGERDADTLAALRQGWGHQHMGVYAKVNKSGDLRQGDKIELL